jgi:hypothetical protein
VEDHSSPESNPQNKKAHPPAKHKIDKENQFTKT